MTSFRGIRVFAFSREGGRGGGYFELKFVGCNKKNNKTAGTRLKIVNPQRKFT